MTGRSSDQEEKQGKNEAASFQCCNALGQISCDLAQVVVGIVGIAQRSKKIML